LHIYNNSFVKEDGSNLRACAKIELPDFEVIRCVLMENRVFSRSSPLLLIEWFGSIYRVNFWRKRK